jgi:hypothetical protein
MLQPEHFILISDNGTPPPNTTGFNNNQYSFFGPFLGKLQLIIHLVPADITPGTFKETIQAYQVEQDYFTHG